MEALRELKDGDKTLEVLMINPSMNKPQKIFQRYERVN
jgi:hypothetical protein